MGAALDHRQIVLRGNHLLHGKTIKLAVCLGARAANGWALPAIQKAELYAGFVSDTAHQTIKRIDLAHKMALPQSANRRIAGHNANSIKAMRHQCGSGASARSSRSRLASRVAAADYNDIKDCGFGRTHEVHPDATRIRFRKMSLCHEWTSNGRANRLMVRSNRGEGSTHE